MQPILGGNVRLSKGTAMLIPQGAAAESSRALEASREDDFVQKAFSAITQKDGLPDELEPSQARQRLASRPAYQFQARQVT